MALPRCIAVSLKSQYFYRHNHMPSQLHDVRKDGEFIPALGLIGMRSLRREWPEIAPRAVQVGGCDDHVVAAVPAGQLRAEPVVDSMRGDSRHDCARQEPPMRSNVVDRQ